MRLGGQRMAVRSSSDSMPDGPAIASARRCRQFKALTGCLVLLGACEVWRPPVPLPIEYDKGLVVMYPGSLNTTSEMIGFYFGLRDGGIDQAIEVVQWGAFLDHIVEPGAAQLRNDIRAREEAERLKGYMDMYPGRPVTLIGYSGGCWFATLTAERMPEGYLLDRVIMISPAFDRNYELTTALDRAANGFFSFWSSGDQFTVSVSDSLNLADSTQGEPAATFGFTMQDTRLVQIGYDPAWVQWGHYGEHADIVLQPAWTANVVAPVVAPGFSP